MITRIAIAVPLLLVSFTLAAQTAEGDRLFAARAEGHEGAHARSAPIDGAIAAYQKAVRENPNDLEARYKLLMAIRFKGAYVARSNEEKKAIYSLGKKAGEDALAIVDRQLRGAGTSSVSKATEQAVAKAAARIANAPEIFFWDSVLWGEWALAYGKMAALREGAADRIRRETTIAMLVNPKIEDGGPPRVLGRLHNQTPHVPFVTGWASDKLAVKYLNQSLAIDPANKITQVFLAEAMVANDSATKPQAVAILRDVLSRPVNEMFLVENLQAQDDARELLKKWGVR